MAQRPFLVGLTGGIGSGKSTAAAMFAGLGVRVIDTDEVARRLTQAGGPAIPAIGAALGVEYLDAAGGLDRAKLRSRIFADTDAKARLEAILHPMILAETRRQVMQPTASPYTLVVVPLLFESGNYAAWLDRVLVVDCAEATQIRRVSARSGWDEAQAQAAIACQMGRAERLARAQDVLSNQGSLEELRQQVGQLHENYLQMASGSR